MCTIVGLVHVLFSSTDCLCQIDRRDSGQNESNQSNAASVQSVSEQKPMSSVPVVLASREELVVKSGTKDTGIQRHRASTAA